MNISGKMSNTNSNFRSNQKFRGKSPYSAFGKNKGVAGRDLAIKHIKNVILSAKTSQTANNVNHMTIFGDKKITIQNWSKLKEENKNEVSYNNRDTHK